MKKSNLFLIPYRLRLILQKTAVWAQSRFKMLKQKRLKNIETDGVFPYIGFTPNVQGFSGQMMQDEKGFIKVDETMRTSTMGVFAVGDVRVTPLRQVITAVADGAVAGVSAVKYIEELKTMTVGAIEG